MAVDRCWDGIGHDIWLDLLELLSLLLFDHLLDLSLPDGQVTSGFGEVELLDLNWLKSWFIVLSLKLM